jgi:hypothetical protein
MLRQGRRTRIGLRTDRSCDELPMLRAVPAPVGHPRTARDDGVDWRVGKDVVQRPALGREGGGPGRAIGGQPRVVKGSLEAAGEARDAGSTERGADRRVDGVRVTLAVDAMQQAAIAVVRNQRLGLAMVDAQALLDRLR